MAQDIMRDAAPVERDTIRTAGQAAREASSMVRVVRQEQSDDDRLDGIVDRLAGKYGLRLDRTGWARKTYDLYLVDPTTERMHLVGRVESLATTNGEVRVFDERGLPFAEELAAELEQVFEVKDATVLQMPPPR
jgi:hypothetical protein